MKTNPARLDPLLAYGRKHWIPDLSDGANELRIVLLASFALKHEGARDLDTGIPLTDEERLDALVELIKIGLVSIEMNDDGGFRLRAHP